MQTLVDGKRPVINRSLVSSWNAGRVYTIMDPTIREVRSDPVSATINMYTFQIYDVPFLAEMATYHEYYKFVSVRAVYTPIITEVVAAHSAADASTFTVPNVAFSFHPYSSIPSSWPEVAQRGSAVLTPSLVQWETTFQPCVLMRAFESLTSDGFVNGGQQWISYDDPNVPHYGMLVALEPSIEVPPSPTFGGRLTFYYTVVFKNPKPNHA